MDILDKCQTQDGAELFTVHHVPRDTSIQLDTPDGMTKHRHLLLLLLNPTVHWL